MDDTDHVGIDVIKVHKINHFILLSTVVVVLQEMVENFIFQAF